MNTRNILCLLPGLLMAWTLRGQVPSGTTPSAGDRQQPQLTFAWGDRYIPLQLWATPYYFKADVELKVEEIWELMNHPIRFYQNGKPYYLPGLQLKSVLQNQDWPLTLEDSAGLFLPFAPPVTDSGEGVYRVPLADAEGVAPEGSLLHQKGYMLGWGSRLALVTDFHPGSKLIFTTPPGKNAGIVLTGLTIKAYNPYEQFQPRFYVPPQGYGTEDYSTWQLVKLSRHPKMLLRYHSKDPGALKVRDMYADNPRYELVPIPFFRTDTRYLSDADYVVPSAEVAGVDTLIAGQVTDPYALEDIIVEWSMGWTLAWGEMTATTSAPYVRHEALQSSMKQPLLLMRDGQPLPVLQVLLTVAPVSGPVHQYLVNGQDTGALQSVLQVIRENVSIYFEDLVVLETNGKPRRLGVPFALHVFGPRD